MPDDTIELCCAAEICCGGDDEDKKIAAVKAILSQRLGPGPWDPQATAVAIVDLWTLVPEEFGMARVLRHASKWARSFPYR